MCCKIFFSVNIVFLYFIPVKYFTIVTAITLIITIFWWDLAAYPLMLLCFLHLPRLVDDLFREAHIKSNGIVKYEEFTAMLTLPPVDYWFFFLKKENNYVKLQDNKLENWLWISRRWHHSHILHMKFGCITFACWYSKGFSQWLFLEYFMINTQYNTLISFHNSPF